MTDEAIANLRADWVHQTIDVERVRRLTEKRRRRTAWLLAGKAAATFAALVSGSAFIVLAARGAPASFAVAGVALLIALPLMGLELTGMARSLRVGDAGTPVAVLRRAHDQAAAARRLLWCHRVAALLLTLSAAALFWLYAIGQASGSEAFAIAPIWLGCALGAWLWQVRRRAQLVAEIERCRALLAELEAIGPDEF